MGKTETPITNIFVAIMLVTIIAGYSIAHEETPKVLAQEVEVVVNTPIQEPKSITVSHNEELSEVEQYIWEVFGDHTPKAMLLLKGKGPGTCKENENLDPKAHNHNWIKDKPGEYWSTDWSIFQINDKFHPVEDLNLRTDWKANVRYAWRMYEADGFTFNRWSCGRIYGI